MADDAHLVYVGLGSNIENPKYQIQTAVLSMQGLPDTHYIKDSGLFLSRPMKLDGDASYYPDYYNAVALLESRLEPLVLLDYLQAIEDQQGRLRKKRWDSRTIDLDILLYGDRQIKHERLQVPHPGLIEREFVLYPLQKIVSEIDIPGHGKLSKIIEACSENGLRYLGEIGEYQ